MAPSSPQLASLRPFRLTLSASHPHLISLGHVSLHPAFLIGSVRLLLPIGTSGHSVEDGLGVVEDPQALDTGARSWVPQPDAIIPPGTCHPAAIGTPRDAI